RDALGRDVELLGGELHHGGEHALADLDLAGKDRDLAGRRKRHPLRQRRMLGERAGERRAHGAAPGMVPWRCAAAAFSTARKMRLWLPQRQMLSSSAAAISARLGAGLRSSSALAETMMPLRQ